MLWGAQATQALSLCAQMALLALGSSQGSHPQVLSSFLGWQKGCVGHKEVPGLLIWGLLWTAVGILLSTTPFSWHLGYNAHFRGSRVLKRGWLHTGWAIWGVQVEFLGWDVKPGLPHVQVLQGWQQDHSCWSLWHPCRWCLELDPKVGGLPQTSSSCPHFSPPFPPPPLAQFLIWSGNWGNSLWACIQFSLIPSSAF